MFSITLAIQKKRLEGLKALEFMRRLGLPENSLAYTEDALGSQFGANNVTVTVDEAFARAYFEPNQRESVARVPVKFLVAGDAQMSCDRNEYAVTLAKMTPERAVELYIAVRFAACRAEVGRLQERVEKLESDLQFASGKLQDLLDNPVSARIE